MNYRAEIDGLRTLAVLPVILFHAGLEQFSGGYVGVDIFFVISGYLITTILLDDLENQRFSLVRFYERRARRILPALFFVILCTLPFAWFWMLPDQLNSFAASILAVSLFVSNLLFWSESGYFAPAAEQKPLLHTWSLAVEEQYYLLFPVFLFLAWRYGKDRIFWMLVLFAILSLALCEWGWRKAPTANYYLAPFRAWELFAGSLVAFIVQKRGVQSNNLVSLVGLLGLIASIFLFDESTPFPSIYAAIPVAGTSLIILFGGHKTLVAALLSRRWMVGIGLISYSVYLWHQPLFAFARIKLGDHPELHLMLALALLSLLLGYLSWQYIERPFRSSNGFNRRAIFTYSSAGLSCLVTLGLGGQINKGFPDRFDVPQFVNAGKFDLPSRDNGYCFYDFNRSQLHVGDEGVNCFLGQASELPARVLLYGDSFAAQWEPYFQKLSALAGINIQSVSTNWCHPSFDQQSNAPLGHISTEQCQYNREWLRTHAHNYDLIILGGAWNWIEAKGFTDGAVESIVQLLELTSAKIVVLDTPVLFERLSVENAIYDNTRSLVPLTEQQSFASQFWDRLSTRFADEARLETLRLANLSDTQYKTPDGYPYSLDGEHISIYGAESLFSSQCSDRQCPALALLTELSNRSVAQ